MPRPMGVIESEQLIIRPFVKEDLDAVHQTLDLEEGDFGTEGRLTHNEREEWLTWTIAGYKQFANLNQPPFGERAIVLKNTHHFIDICGFVPYLDFFEQLNAPSPHTTSELGLFYAIRKEQRGNGYATESAKALADYAFSELQVKKIIATTTYTNLASIGVMQRLGMELKSNPLPTPIWLQIVGMLYNPLLCLSH